MPFVSKTGDVVHGKGGMGAFYNNAQFDYGGGPCWLNKAIGDIAVYQHGGGPGETGEGWYLHFYNVHTGEKWRAIQDPASPFYGMGFNFLSADGGVWAAHTVLPGIGLWASTGLHLPYAGLLSVGPEGEIAYAPNYQSGAQSVVQQVDGYIWDLSPSVVYDLQLLGGQRAIWTEGPSILRVKGIPMPQILPGGCWGPHALFIQGEWWICYYSGVYGVVLHPFNSFTGYSVVPSGDAWMDTTVLTADTIRVVWSITEGEIAGHIRMMDINILTQHRVDLFVPIVEPPIEPPIEPPMTEIPYEFDIVQEVNNEFPHLLQQNTGATAGEFTERVVWELSRKDSNWGHVGKRPGQNQHNGHAIDAIMYRAVPDKVVDIIIGAGDETPTNPAWGEDISAGQPWMEPIPVDGTEPPPSDGTHLYIGGENDTAVCDDCGRSRFDSVHEIPESKVPHMWDPGENGQGLCDICQKEESDPIHLGEPPPVEPPSNVQNFLDDWLEQNPEAQEYITKLYHVPEGALAPPDANYQVRLNPTDNTSNHLTVAAVTTDKGTAFCEMILSLGR